MTVSGPLPIVPLLEHLKNFAGDLPARTVENPNSWADPFADVG